MEIDLNLSDSLTLSDSIQIGRGISVSSQLVLSDSAIIELGPILFTQVPVEILTSSTSLVHWTQGPVELLVPTAGLIQLQLSDTITFSDNLKIGRGLVIAETLTMTDSVAAVASGPETLQLSDSITTLSDSIQTRIAVQIHLLVSDTMTLTDTATPFLSIPKRQMTQLPVEVLTTNPSLVHWTQGPVELLVPTAGLMQLHLSDTITLTDSFVKSLSTIQQKSVADQMVMSDSFKFVGTSSLTLSDTITLSDSIQTRLSTTLTLTLSDSGGGNWTDSVSTQLAILVGLSESLSDSLNFWGDSFQEVMTFIPRVAPSGDPTDNCCPPNIFITD